ncbi:HNH endonuclease [Vibrio parahaemolyticus]|uniref:HNH endonuclease n=1 Tax=Vibrio parahaemolyticus TaxID=670 RepID=UPI00084AD7CC|nr:HNH endonuclease [Vibrio parahaemolyticus]ELA9558570.1 HNH endonuclease [Vibrio parahaemolyticus]ODX36573.1 hypothetical protein BBM03_09090 [Vibrio parahaemolyticus]OMP49128.1 HNH endonuclease [Vibrio parahaemolyticus]
MVFGEKAHIVGVNGPRANEPLSCDLNDYDNLIWLCRNHHKIIDAPVNEEKYSVDLLKQMKAEHERCITNGQSYLYRYQNSLEDYAKLSCLFSFVDINKLYSNVIGLPQTLDPKFFDFEYYLDLYEEENGPLVLADKLIFVRYRNFKFHYMKLKEFIDGCMSYDYKDVFESTEIYHCEVYDRIKYSPHVLDRLMTSYLQSVEDFIVMVERRFVDIIYQPLYDPGL